MPQRENETLALAERAVCESCGTVARSISPALDPAGHFTVTITLNLLASDIETELQSAHDLVAWAAVTDFALESITRDAVNGTAVLVYRSLNLPGATGDRDFLRWRVTTP